MSVDEELARALSAENVRRFLDGEIDVPMPGTLARRVYDYGETR